jgi:hypothetical protein
MNRVTTLLGTLPLLLSLWTTPAQAASHCLVSNESSCRLKIDKQGFRIQVDERGQIVVVFGNTTAELDRGESYVVVQEDLDRLESNQIFTPNESAQIRAELTNYDGTAYMVPEADELKAALNLPATEVVGPHDYMDLIQVHMQLVLSFSAFTSAYLGELMGVAVLEAGPAAVAPADVPAAVPSPTPAPVATPEPAPTPTPESTPVPAFETQTQS